MLRCHLGRCCFHRAGLKQYLQEAEMKVYPRARRRRRLSVKYVPTASASSAITESMAAPNASSPGPSQATGPLTGGAERIFGDIVGIGVGAGVGTSVGGMLVGAGVKIAKGAID